MKTNTSGFHIFVHNVIFTVLLVLGNYVSRFLNSSGSLLMPVVIPSTYWVAGWILIFEERRLKKTHQEKLAAI